MAEGGTEEESGEMLGPAAVPHQSPSALNVVIKAEESDRESSCGSPEPATTMGVDAGIDLHTHHAQDLQTATSMTTSSTVHKLLNAAGGGCGRPDDVDIKPAAAAHLNGAMAGLGLLQNLQSLASLQSLPQVASLAAGLQSMANSAAAAAAATQQLHAPLNLSVGASSNVAQRNAENNAAAALQSQLQTSLAAAATAPQQPAPMPQFILASGQLVQGIQGAQLLIPTSQGLATQTILTIPVNHVNSTDQMVNLALNNGQVVQTSLANLQAMAQGQNNMPAANSIPTLPTPTPTTNGNHVPSNMSPLFNSTNLSHLLSNGTTTAAQQLLQTLPQLLSNAHAAAAAANNLSLPTLPLTPPGPAPGLLTHASPPLSTSHRREAPPTHREISRELTIANHYPESKLHQSTSLSRNSSPPNHMSSTLNRLSASNGELTITTTSLPPSVAPSATATSATSTVTASQVAPLSNATNASHTSHTSQKRSPSLSPRCDDSSTADLLIDSPNQPTINQTSSNVVDGINLDEIKDFAKAFKLRRLSLGLTQTQVGQALSVTEGPAYSQSAICSALASQMFAAAQLSSQQQAMFEKLDITPKSAQKIKPVLERWMKEAEDRYKSGQNHLTDFIGIEPSKKRKRRTSFTPQALELLNAHFERNTHPSGTEITGLAHQLGYEREVIRIWFCNKRQALKNTVRMMSKGMV
ncbi:POU domain, class 6, transcription factor 1-like isoform X2 [Atheta coriaria]|uniref:POU domain, class 6, transcription factor 1-like isoform X2 n=1 Tax=Dalotia coriaria TaxID=877792 RepID=UPI0031F41F9D